MVEGFGGEILAGAKSSMACVLHAFEMDGRVPGYSASRHLNIFGPMQCKQDHKILAACILVKEKEKKKRVVCSSGIVNLNSSSNWLSKGGFFFLRGWDVDRVTKAGEGQRATAAKTAIRMHTHGPVKSQDRRVKSSLLS